MKYYRVKIGYGKDEFISVDETELAMALRAQISGRVGIFKEGTVAGNHIISITPDLQRFAGYKRDYQLTGEDYDEIGMEAVNEHRHFLEDTKLSLDGDKMPALK